MYPLNVYTLQSVAIDAARFHDVEVFQGRHIPDLYVYTLQLADIHNF